MTLTLGNANWFVEYVISVVMVLSGLSNIQANTPIVSAIDNTQC